MLRRATVGDARSIALVQVRAWLVAYEDIVPPERMAALDVDELAERWPGWIERMDVQVAEAGGRVVGFVASGAARDPRCEGEGELYAIYVDPTAQGAGLGSKLLAAGETALGGFGAAHLWTFAANGLARRFYESRGWALDPEAEVPDGHEPAAPEVRYRKQLG